MKYFTIFELSVSVVAQRFGMDNTPPVHVMHNLEKLTRQLLDPARELWGKPLVVTSGYRCKELNRMIGGVSNSQHLTGCAADIVTLGNNRMQNYQLYLMIKNSGLPYDQLIAEDCQHLVCGWVHVSFDPLGKPRRESFEMHRSTVNRSN